MPGSPPPTTKCVNNTTRWLQILAFALIPATPCWSETLVKQRREPIKLIVRPTLVAVLNRDSGTISLVDRQSRKVRRELQAGRRPAEMLLLSERGETLILDQFDREARVLSLVGPERIRTLGALSFPPTKAVWDAKNRKLYVSSQWERRLGIISLAASDWAIQEQRWLELPFAPRNLMLLNEQTVLVATAFGGELAAVDTSSHRVVVKQIRGHNIRGLAISRDGEYVLVAHQRMAASRRADYEELHWGRLLANGVQLVEAKQFQSAVPQVEGWLDAYGGIGGATGDPSNVITGPEGMSAVAFSGVDEVAVRYDGSARRIRVGSRPEAMAVAGSELIVANRFDDSLSIIDMPTGRVVETISLGPAPSLNAAERGARLFFNARVSHDGWVSCHSCHADGHSSGLLVDTLGDGDYGAAKRVPSLLALRGTAPFGWIGGADTLREQIAKSVSTTMHGNPLEKSQMDDLVEFLNRLDPPPPTTVDQALAKRGRVVFERQACNRCHAGDRLTSADTYSVGLKDEKGRKRFNPPTLHGVRLRNSFFHDGRAGSLEEVLGKWRHQLNEPLSDGERTALLEYLRSL